MPRADSLRYACSAYNPYNKGIKRYINSTKLY